MSALSAADGGSMDRAFPQLLDWLTDMSRLLEMGYPRDFVVKALLKVGPRQMTAAIQYIDALQLQG